MQGLSRGDSIRRFARHYETLLTVLGALVLLMSFVVRDEMQAESREQLTALHQSRTEFRVRQDIFRLPPVLTLFHNSDLAQTDSLPQEDLLRQRTSWRDRVYHAIWSDQARLYAVVDFVRETEIGNDPSIKRLGNKMNVVFSTIKKGRTIAAANFLAAQSSFELMFADLAELALKAVDRREVELQRKIDIVNALGAAMFVFGWLLSTFSRLFGLRPLDEQST